MCSFLRRITMIGMAFALAGCQLGEISMGNLSPSVQEYYEIVGSDYDRSFDMAYLAIEESGLEIIQSNRESGQIYARNRTAEPVGSDTRAFITNFSELGFSLKKTESGKVIFNVESKSSSGSLKLNANFLKNYDRHVDFSEIKSVISETKPVANLSSSQDDGPIISETRTAKPTFSAATKNYEFSKQEIIQIQTFLKKLGYNPGPADGEMNSNTMEAIEKFKTENRTIGELFK